MMQNDFCLLPVMIIAYALINTVIIRCNGA